MRILWTLSVLTTVCVGGCTSTSDKSIGSDEAIEAALREVGDEVLGQRQLALQALIARLQTEQAGRAQIDFPEPIASSIAAEIVELREIQIDVFRNRTDARRARVSALQKQITQLEAEIDGLNSLISSQTVQADLLGSEIATVTQLFNDGLAPEARLLELRRRFAEITGARAENSAKIARSRQSIGQIELEVRVSEKDYGRLLRAFPHIKASI